MRLFGSERLMKMFTSLGVDRRMSRLSIRCFPMPSRKRRRRSRATTSESVKTCWTMTRLTMSRERSFTKSVVGTGRREHARCHLQDDHRYRRQYTVDMCFSDDIDPSEWDLDELNRCDLLRCPMEAVTTENVKGHEKDEMKHMVKEEGCEALRSERI